VEINEVSGAVIGAAIRVHSELGPGLLESAYQACLVFELRNRGFAVETEVALPVSYRGMRVDAGYRLDILVEDIVVVEVKAVEAIHPIHRAQLLSYLRLSHKRLGLLLNFNTLRLSDGITRMVDRL
jgi:GxxExxY protein